MSTVTLSSVAALAAARDMSTEAFRRRALNAINDAGSSFPRPAARIREVNALGWTDDDDTRDRITRWFAGQSIEPGPAPVEYVGLSEIARAVGISVGTASVWNRKHGHSGMLPADVSIAPWAGGGAIDGWTPERAKKVVRWLRDRTSPTRLSLRRKDVATLDTWGLSEWAREFKVTARVFASWWSEYDGHGELPFPTPDVLVRNAREKVEPVWPGWLPERRDEIAQWIQAHRSLARPALSDAEVVRLHEEQDWSWRQLAAHYGMSQAAIRKRYDRYKRTGEDRGAARRQITAGS